ncbi:hypothetical protein DESPIG_00013 [Desulfovibrio piger ATCC 29098]|uniref:Uncharacterized protein n=1 Tax=Desulfovibrio piger ATCC 29098 TaxID=411464 RepID=B6WPP8_9BACT|nr:hypothetical protein DESPIG_00013 [Desulfovibrio piger ATCC 29098]
MSRAYRHTPPRLPGTDLFLANSCPKLSRAAPRKRGHLAVSPAYVSCWERLLHGSRADGP